MKRSPHNQINASFIDILRIKLLVFLLWSSFFRTTSTVCKLQSNGLFDRHPVEQIAYRRDIKYKFLAGTSKEQVMDKGIRQRSTKE